MCEIKIVTGRRQIDSRLPVFVRSVDKIWCGVAIDIKTIKQSYHEFSFSVRPIRMPNQSNQNKCDTKMKFNMKQIACYTRVYHAENMLSLIFPALFSIHKPYSIWMFSFWCCSHLLCHFHFISVSLFSVILCVIPFTKRTDGGREGVQNHFHLKSIWCCQWMLSFIARSPSQFIASHFFYYFIDGNGSSSRTAPSVYVM